MGMGNKEDFRIMHCRLRRLKTPPTRVGVEDVRAGLRSVVAVLVLLALLCARGH